MSDLYLIHSKKGSQKANHKYISREWKNGKWVYKYKPDSWWSATEGKTPREAIQKSFDTKRMLYNESMKDHKKFLSEARNAAQYGMKRASRDYKEAADSTLRSAKRVMKEEWSRDARNLRKAKEEEINKGSRSYKIRKKAENIVGKLNEKKVKRHANSLIKNGR